MDCSSSGQFRGKDGDEEVDKTNSYSCATEKTQEDETKVGGCHMLKSKEDKRVDGNHSHNLVVEAADTSHRWNARLVVYICV